MIETDVGCALVHLGMSGSLRILEGELAAGKHDHVDLKIASGKVLRYNDPRRFGAWLWTEEKTHPLLEHLGPEPLTTAFDADYIASKACNRRLPVKSFIMDNKVVVGVGNIYANEALFNARILPTRAANNLDKTEWLRLVEEIKLVLSQAIQRGGTTLKDFAQTDGKPGYFAQQLQVYGRAGQACSVCGEEISEQKIGQRNTFFCRHCQQ